jgi:hypothetical protein
VDCRIARYLAVVSLIGLSACRGEELDSCGGEGPNMEHVRVEDGAERPVATVCDGDPMAQWLGIEAPLPPAELLEPPSVVWTDVDDTASLLEAVNEGAPHIRLASGSYGAEGLDQDFLQIRGQQLWAAEPGKVRLEFGVQAGGNNEGGKDFGGSELHGLVFDIHDPSWAAATTKERAAIVAWGGATGLVVEDCEIFGNSVLSAGIYISSPDASSIARVRITNTRRWGILIVGETPSAAAEIEDVQVIGVHGHKHSDAGVGLRLGATAHVRRVLVREARFAGIATLDNSAGTTLSHIDIDTIGLGQHARGGGVGVYFDDTTRDTVLENFCIGPTTKIAVNSEWDHHPDAQLAHPRGVDNVVRHGLSDAWFVGVHFDQGTVNGEVHDVVFRGYERAAIIFHNNVSAEELWPNYDDGSHQHDNVFEVPQADGEVCDLTYTIWNSAGPVACVGGSEAC